MDVVLMDILAQFERLAVKLDGQPYGLSVFTDELRKTIGIRNETDRRGYPQEDSTAVMAILNVARLVPRCSRHVAAVNAVAAADEPERFGE